MCSFGSGSSSRSKGVGYRTVASSSSVDESLFASKSPSKKKQEQEPDFIEVVTKDSIRKLRARTKKSAARESTNARIILSSNDYERIKKAAQVLSKEEQDEKQKLIKNQKQRAMAESEARKARLNEYEEVRQRELSSTNMAEGAESSSLLRRAKEQMDETEDEIKHLNELIIYAKCVAIRDVQVKEKEMINKARILEDRRLDEIEEQKRQLSLAQHVALIQDRHVERCRGAEVIRHQILEREEQRQIDQEIRDQETMALLKHLEKVKADECLQQSRKKEAQLELMAEVEQANKDLKLRRLEQIEKEKKQEEEIIDYIKHKDEMHEKILKETESKRREREDEIARIRAQQERSQDHKKAQDALRAKRALEEAERQARAKERVDGVAKRKTVEDLNNARAAQIRDQTHFAAMQAHRDRLEFNTTVSMEQQNRAKEKEKLEAQAVSRKKHIKEVQEQIKKKEHDLYVERKNFFQAGVTADKERDERAQKIRQIKNRKIEQLRKQGVPQQYIEYVEREAFNEKAQTFSQVCNLRN